MRRSQFYLTRRSRNEAFTPGSVKDRYTESHRTPNLPWRHDRILHASSSLRLVSAPDKIYKVRSPLKDCRQLGDNVKTIVLDPW
ncbi:MAG: hypothetical protein ACBR50_12495 [Microcoleus sp.]